MLLKPRLTFYFSWLQNYVDLDTVDIILLQTTQTSSFIGQWCEGVHITAAVVVREKFKVSYGYGGSKKANGKEFSLERRAQTPSTM